MPNSSNKLLISQQNLLRNHLYALQLILLISNGPLFESRSKLVQRHSRETNALQLI